MNDAYEAFLFLDIVRAGIGHARDGIYERFYGIVFDYDNAKLRSAYVANDALVAAIVDPRTKALEGLLEDDAQCARDALGCRRNRGVSRSVPLRMLHPMTLVQETPRGQITQAQRRTATEYLRAKPFSSACVP